MKMNSISTVSSQSTGIESQLDIKNVLLETNRFRILKIRSLWGEMCSLYRTEDNQMTTSHSPLPPVYDMAVAKDGIVWMVTHRGVFAGTDNSLLPVHIGERGASQRGWRAVAVVGDTVWIGGRCGLISIRPDGCQTTVEKGPDGPLPCRSVRTLTSDGKGGLWVGTGSGMRHLDYNSIWGGVVLPQFPVIAAYVDDEGVLAMVNDNYRYRYIRLFPNGDLESLGSKIMSTRRTSDGVIECLSTRLRANQRNIGGNYTTTREPSKWSARISGGTVLTDTTGKSFAIEIPKIPSKEPHRVNEISSNGKWVVMFGSFGVALIDTDEATMGETNCDRVNTAAPYLKIHQRTY